MAFLFRLAIYDETFTHLIPVEEYLKLRSQGIYQWKPSLDDSGFLLKCQEKDWLGETINMGNLALIVRQMEHALIRLTNGTEAIIRSGVLDRDVVPYMLFEYSSHNEIAVSLFTIDEPDVGMTFPFNGFSGKAEDLYAYVRDHRDEIMRQPEPSNRLFKRLVCPGIEFVSAMAQEAQFGRQLFDVLGVPMVEGQS